MWLSPLVEIQSRPLGSLGTRLERRWRRKNKFVKLWKNEEKNVPNAKNQPDYLYGVIRTSRCLYLLTNLHYRLNVLTSGLFFLLFFLNMLTNPIILSLRRLIKQTSRLRKYLRLKNNSVRFKREFSALFGRWNFSLAAITRATFLSLRPFNPR